MLIWLGKEVKRKGKRFAPVDINANQYKSTKYIRNNMKLGMKCQRNFPLTIVYKKHLGCMHEFILCRV